MRRRIHLVANCKTDGTLSCYETPEEIAKQLRRKEFFKHGGTSELYLFSIGVKKAIGEFRQGR